MSNGAFSSITTNLLLLELSRHTCTQSLFELVIGPNQNRIHGRFQSVHWDKPKSRIHTKEPEPLYGWLRKVVRQLEQRRSKDPVGSAILIQRIRHLCDFLQRIDQLKKGNAKCMLLLKEIVKESYHLCTLDGNLTLDETIAHHGFAPYEITLNKHIRQVDKIGRYWGLCLSMTEDSRRYAGLFTNVKLKTLRPYEGATSHIALIQGQRARCLVHAEMQIIVFYGNSANTATLKPRIIGASKSACYLCNLFNVHHGQYFITKTHGHLYERWNFPDLAKYGPRERDEYRRVLTAMDTELQAATIRERNAKRRRQPPMGSWLTLPRIHQYSPVPSTVLSSQQDVSKPLTPQAPTPTQTTPPHSPSYPTAEVTMDNTPPTSSPPRQPDSRSTLLPMPPSPPPAYTANQHNANAPRVSLPEPQRPDVPPATHPLGLSSSSSIESWEYPVQRTITAATPFLKKSGKVPIAFEIEEPALGSITIADSTNSTSRLPINISALKEGETLSFSRKDEDDCVVLELQNPNGKTTQLTLRWLWNEQTEREH